MELGANSSVDERSPAGAGGSTPERSALEARPTLYKSGEIREGVVRVS